MRPLTPILAAAVAAAAALAACHESREKSAAAPQPSGTQAGSTPTAAKPAEPVAQRFTGLGDHTRRITTSSAEAQAWFDQGAAFLAAFNHDEARRSFQRAATLDPSCAIAWWGVAITNGPHINFPMVTPEQAMAARAALDRAKAPNAHASPVERELIAALDQRYAYPQPEDRRPLDVAYAQAMREVWSRHGDDADIGAWYAESEMDLRPWDLWSQQGEPREETPRVLAALEAAMRVDPRHPLANHLYIHAVEASPDPARGAKSADTLRDLCPGLGHLVHMPSHIDVLTGHWAEAVAANTAATAVDHAYRLRVPQQDFYRVYMAHNQHMLAFAAMMRGQSALAVDSLRAMVADIPVDWLRQNAVAADGFAAMPYEALVRFGRWDEMLAEPEPAAYLPMSRGLWHAARGTALAAKKDIPGARSEQAALAAARATVPKEATFGRNTSDEVLGVAAAMLDGEITLRSGDREAGIAALRAAVAKEDALHYDEPPSWLIMIRHSLGAALMESGRNAEAEQVYRDDLARWPNNGWSLYGLTSSLKALGRLAEAAETDQRFRTVWAKADIAISSSCCCLPGK